MRTGLLGAILAAFAFAAPPAFDDSGLAPVGLESLCALPNLPVFNVKHYGAKGDNATDDTLAIRVAIAAAVSAGGGIIYLPTGRYAVAPQVGDGPVMNNASSRVAFHIKTSNLVFIGDGPGLSQLIGYMPGLVNPVTTWTDISDTDDYFRVQRFGMFAIDTTASGGNAPIDNIQFRSLTIDGQAGYTGDHTVGSSMSVASATVSAGGSGYAVGDIIKLSRPSASGVGRDATFQVEAVSSGAVTSVTLLTPGVYGFLSKVNPEATTASTGRGAGCTLLVTRTMTGDGWDLTHKAIHANGPNAARNVLVFNTTLSNWRGEVIYGPNVGISIVKSHVYGTNSSAVSISGNVFVSHSLIGGPNDDNRVYNGFENFAFPGNDNTIQDSTIQRADANGIAFISYPTGTLTVARNLIDRTHNGILFSEAGHNVQITGNMFTNNVNAMITSVLGLYPELNGHTGFDNFTVSGNTFDHSGSALVVQDYGSGSFPNLRILNNTVTNGNLLSGGFGAAGIGDWTGFVVDGNTLGSGAQDLTGQYAGGHFALWSNTNRPAGTASTGTAAKFDQFSTSDVETTISPKTDLTWLNANLTTGSNHYAVIDPRTLSGYPVGFTTLFIRGFNAWTLKADPAWNDFPSDVPVGVDSVAIRMSESGRFVLVEPRIADRLRR